MSSSSSLDGIILIDEEGRIVQLNRAGELLFRCNAADICGRSLESLVPGGLAVLKEKYALAGERETAAGSSSEVYFNLSYYACRYDGSTFPASISFCIFRTRDRQMAYVWVIEVPHIGQEPFSLDKAPQTS